MREIKIKDISWVSVSNPQKKDIDELREKFPDIHRLVLEELLTSTIRPRVEDYAGNLFMVLHFPRFIQKSKKTVSHEVDFILLPNALVTVQYDDNTLLEHFWHQNNDDNIEEHYGKTPLHFLYYLLRGYFSFLVKELDQIQSKIDAIEEKVFAEKERDALKDISLLRRSILDFRRAIKPQQITLESLAVQGAEMYGSKVRPLLNDLIGEYTKVWNLLENHQETLDSLYETNNSLLTLKSTETMKVFTWLAFMTFVPMTLAGILGLSFPGTPFAHDPSGFWLAFGFILIVTAVSYLILKIKKLV